MRPVDLQPEAKAPTTAVIEADLSRQDHAEAVVRLLDMYSREPVANGAPLAPQVKRDLVDGLRSHPTSLVFLAYQNDRAVGLAVCFIGFSTFAARRLINLHDVAVTPDARRLGVGRALLAAVEARAMQLDCCKLTLEVMNDNLPAKRLYADLGFAPYALETNTSTALLLQKKLGPRQP